MDLKNPNLTVICGSMFSHKTETLLHLLHMAQLSGLPTELFKPSVDSRSENVRSHNGRESESVTVSDSENVLAVVKRTNPRVVGIDEVQFFANDIVDVIREIVFGMRKVVIAAGLDLDYRGLPFGPMPWLLCMATAIDKRKAVCNDCHTYAYCISYRLNVSSRDQIEIGGDDLYCPLCLTCFSLRRGCS